MKNWEDKISSGLKIALDILFVKNPVGTSMGILFGIILHGLISVLYPVWETLQKIKLSSLNIAHYMAIGIFGFNVKSFFSRYKIDPGIEEALAFIQKQVKEGRISKIDAKIQYKNLIARVIENVQLDFQTQSKANAINRALK